METRLGLKSNEKPASLKAGWWADGREDAAFKTAHI
jgi:hypothetical protein